MKKKIASFLTWCNAVRAFRGSVNYVNATQIRPTAILMHIGSKYESFAYTCYFEWNHEYIIGSKYKSFACKHVLLCMTLYEHNSDFIQQFIKVPPYVVSL